MGYAGQALPDRIDIYRLDLTNFSIQRLETCGISPAGGMHHHKAELIGGQGQAAIKITTEEVKEPIIKEAGKEFTTQGSITAPDGKELVATEESKIFTLRINDMRWI